MSRRQHFRLWREVSRVANTSNKLNEIETTLMAYRLAYNRLPCPADPVLEVSFREDNSQTRSGRAAANLGMRCRVALSLLKRAGTKGSIRTRRMKGGWDDDYLLQVLQGFTAE